MDAMRFKEIIDFAIAKEREAVDAYTAASEMVKRSNVKETLLGLAKQEEGHKRKLESIEPGKVSQAHIEKVPDLKIADYTDNAEITANMDYQDVLIVAMKREGRRTTCTRLSHPTPVTRISSSCSRYWPGRRLATSSRWRRSTTTTC